MTPLRPGLVWAAIAAALAIPLAAAATSPLLEWRSPVYIAAGLAGVALLGLVLLQPLLVAGYLPGVSAPRGRRIHRIVGAALVAAVLLHVGGLWITSPPDMVDALLFASPTPFSPFGVIAMWAIFAAALLATFRRRLALRPQTWRRTHMALVTIIVLGGVVHALLIEGTMEPISKAALCIGTVAATIWTMIDLCVWRRSGQPRPKSPGT